MTKRSTKFRPIPEADRKRAKAAYELLGRIQEATGIPPRLSNEELIGFGAKLHPYTYEGGATDDEALGRLIKSVNNDVFVGSEILRVQLHIPNEQCMIMWAARWVDQGCPRFIFDSRYASLLMATDVGRDVLDRIVFPWRAFLIEMPELLTIADGKGELHPIKKVYVQVMRAEKRGYDTLNILAVTDHGLQLWRHGVDLGSLTTTKPRQEGGWGIGIKTDTRDNRVLNLIGRLVISMCVALSDPDNYHKQQPKKKKKHWKHRLGIKHGHKAKLPEVQTFIIGRPTKINCRPALIEYVDGSGKRNSPTVRFLVRGHWKFQPHGPGRSLRKLIQIDPYWKGPEEAKILTRTVRMDESE